MALANEEITLVDLWTALMRHRRLIAIIWVLVMAASLAYLLSAPKIFESHSVLRIGRSSGEPIMSIRTLVLALKDTYGVDSRNREHPFLASIKQEGDDALILTAEGRSGEDAQNFLSQVVQKIVDEQSQSYRHMRQAMEAELSTLDSRVIALDSEIKRLWSAPSRQTNQAATAVLMLQNSALQTSLVSLLETRMKLRRELFALNTYPTQVLRGPGLSKQPSKPHVKLILGVAMLLGVLLGLIGAFFVNLATQVRQQQH